MSLLSSQGDNRAPLRLGLIRSDDNTYLEIVRVLSSLQDPPITVVDRALDAGPETNGDAGVDIIAIVVDEREPAPISALERLSQSTPGPTLVALLKERSAALMRRALRAGADEVMFLPLDPSDITRVILKISEARRRTEQAGGGGRIISLVSVTGGVGVTTLSASLALALNQRHPKRIGLIDLDFQTAALAVFLNLEPERTITMLTDQSRPIDSIQLESTLTRHESGIYLLAAPKRIEEGEAVSEAVVNAVLDLMRQLFDFVIVDCGSHLGENTVAAWEGSDQLLYVLDQSIIATRCAVRFIDLLEKLHLEVHPGFILNRFDSKRSIGEELITRTLARPLLARISSDEKIIERTQLSGQDPWQTPANSPFARSIDELVGKLTFNAQPGPAQGHGGLLFNLLRAIGGRG